MSSLTKQQLLKPPRRVLVVDVPRLGGTIRLQEPSAAALMKVRKLQKLDVPGEVGDDTMASMIAAICVDEHDNILFTHEEALGVFGVLPIDSATLIVRKFNELAVPPKPDEKKDGEPAGNSEPSPTT